MLLGLCFFFCLSCIIMVQCCQGLKGLSWKCIAIKLMKQLVQGCVCYELQISLIIPSLGYSARVRVLYFSSLLNGPRISCFIYWWDLLYFYVFIILIIRITIRVVVKWFAYSVKKRANLLMSFTGTIVGANGERTKFLLSQMVS